MTLMPPVVLLGLVFFYLVPSVVTLRKQIPIANNTDKLRRKLGMKMIRRKFSKLFLFTLFLVRYSFLLL